MCSIKGEKIDDISHPVIINLMHSGMVFDIMHFSTHDGPGIRTTVFLKGCPLQCAWCHNPESQSSTPEIMLRPNLCIGCLACLKACPNQAITRSKGNQKYDRSKCLVCGRCVDVCMAGARELVGRQMTTEAIMVEIEKDRPFYEESGGGVTFSGGEAMLQFDFLKELLRTSKTRGLHTTLDTCGFAPWEQFEEILPDVDLFLYDIKSLNDYIHQKYTGVSNQLILENLRGIASHGKQVIIRVPFIPGINDTPDQLRELGELAESLGNLTAIEILPYHKMGLEKYKRLGLVSPLSDNEPPEPYQVEAAIHILKRYHPQVTTGI